MSATRNPAATPYGMKMLRILAGCEEQGRTFWWGGQHQTAAMVKLERDGFVRLDNGPPAHRTIITDAGRALLAESRL